MCLSTVYLNERKETNILMENVMKVQKIMDEIVVTDLMDRTRKVRGEITEADLNDSWIIIKER